MNKDLNIRKIEMLSNTIQIIQDSDVGIPGMVWDAALVFTRWLNKNPKLIQERYNIKNSTILELGSGTGASGVCMSILKPKQLIITDLAENLSLINKNVEANNTIIQEEDGRKLDQFISVYALKWGKECNDTQDLVDKFGKIDLAIGTDLIYDGSQNLVDTLDILYKANPKIVFILALTAHKQHENNKFAQNLKNSNWKMDLINVEELDERFQADDIGLIQIEHE